MRSPELLQARNTMCKYLELDHLLDDLDHALE